ncbi:PREDICTED: probable E3 ubiquitin ligase SUD1 isoform X1 [Tarenaya hassleriana]|uniref:probable E3 ubiquitin ligase SUD1 isoform X1 n=1 Tax=Tarenaya hassleriana TaxID=28532 RepID=UPI00053C53DE|nr:PREDICTED: probable E3 ubiquitin ligase SUD1 isoform X1 [Tarenaya hassleriana]
MDIEDEEICRICRLPGDQDNPLRYPCECKGSIKFVHQECLLQWLNQRQSEKCEICRHRFSFAPVYLDNAPNRLTLTEFMIGLGTRVFNLVKPWVLFFLAWFVVIPLSTYWIIRLALGKAATDKTERYFMTKLSVPWIASASVLGGCYCSWIALLMVGISIVRASTVWLDGILAPLPAEIIIQIQGLVGVPETIFWRHTRILCDWWYQFIDLPLGPQAAFVRNAPLHEFEAIRRFLFFLDDNVFVVLVTNVFVSYLFVLVPFSIGQIVLTLLDIFPPMRPKVLSTPVLAGYVILLTLIFSYLGSSIALKLLSILRISLVSFWKSLSGIIKHFITITRWFLVGLPSLILKFPSLLWNSLVAVWKNLAEITKQLAAIVMIAPVLSIKFGVLPLILGFWVDICTFPVPEGTITHRLEFLSADPSMNIIYWSIGIFYLAMAWTYLDLIQKIVHKRAFWFLQDVTDPLYRISELHLCGILFALAFHGVFIVIVLHVPVKMITLLCPSFFPLKFWNSSGNFGLDLAEIYAFNHLAKETLRMLGNLTDPTRVEPIVRKWFISVSSWLQLNDFLLEVPQSNADQTEIPLLGRNRWPGKWLVVYAIAEGSMILSPEDRRAYTSEDDIDPPNDSRFPLKITLLLVLGGLSLLLVSTAFMSLPLLLGRAFFNFVPTVVMPVAIKSNDLYAIWLGYHILRKTQYAYDRIQTGRIVSLLHEILMFMRNLLLILIWIVVIPVLLGILIDLMVIIPLRVPIDETPVFLLIQDWLLGLVYLHIWILLVALDEENGRFATRAWREKLRRIRNVGINQLPTMWLLREVLGSFIITLLTALCLPCVLVTSVVSMLGYSSAVSSAVRLFVWPAFLSVILAWLDIRLISDLVIRLHRMILDDRYLVGHRLIDLTEDGYEGESSSITRPCFLRNISEQVLVAGVID